jgi:hypothetical protein
LAQLTGGGGCRPSTPPKASYSNTRQLDAGNGVKKLEAARKHIQDTNVASTGGRYFFRHL